MKALTRFPVSMLEAGAIMALAPFVFAARMNALATATPAGAAIDLQRFATEKAVAAANSAVALGFEAMRQSVAIGAAVVAQDCRAVARSADRIAAAALRPVSRRVRSNARASRRKRAPTR